jgi:uncharacterized protein
MKPIASFFWRKLDQPGYDSCRLFKASKGWLLNGAAVFFDSGRSCFLQYEVEADAAWQTRRAKVSGFVGRNAVELRIRSTAKQHWTADGEEQGAVEGCVDLDLGFTPATNLIAVRRLSLRVGQEAEAPAAYLAFPKLRIEKIAQTYRRVGRTEYEYEAPRFGYKGRLVVSTIGAVTHYPGLFDQVQLAKTDRRLPR